MTTVQGANVHNLAVEGNFDDCQNIVKAAFADQSFLPEGRQLAAVNSINWARIMVQIVYYFYASLSLGGPHRSVSFSVPTGNFGDIYAGYLAREIGLPIKQLIVATNANDILHRFISSNDYSVADLTHTLSPSMDIMISSNFERYLFDVFGRDAKALREFITPNEGHSKRVTQPQWEQIRQCFDSYTVNDEATCDMIRQIFAESEVIIDPHTAVGVRSGRSCNKDKAVPMITLATAHPVKFSDAINAAGIKTPALPPHLADLMQREEYYQVIENSIGAVSSFIAEKVSS
jgi:threonine synthase